MFRLHITNTAPQNSTSIDSEIAISPQTPTRMPNQTQVSKMKNEIKIQPKLSSEVISNVVQQMKIKHILSHRRGLKTGPAPTVKRPQANL